MPTGFKVLMGGAAVLVMVFVGWTLANRPGDAVDNLPVSHSPAVPVAKAPPTGSLANDVTRSPSGAQRPPPPTGSSIRDIDTESRNRPGGSLTQPQPQPAPTQSPTRDQTPPLPPVVRPGNATPGGGAVPTEPPPSSPSPGGTASPGGEAVQPPGRINQPTGERPAPGGAGSETLTPVQPAPTGTAPPSGSTGATLPPIRVPDQPAGTTGAEPGRRPTGSPAPAGPTLTDPTSEHGVAEGDTLIAIADRYYSDEDLWPAIKLANPGLEENRLFVGKKLRIPSKSEAQRLIAEARSGAPARPAQAETRTPVAGDTAKPTVNPPAGTQPPAVGGRTYVVGEGDSLIKIARTVLKDENRWRELFELNRDKLDKPDRLLVGMKLRLPEK